MPSPRDLLSGLNPQQARAVTHLDGPLRIVAGAGTGKTGTLATRFAYLAGQGVPADRILVLTFSRRAAREFRDRALTLLDTSYRRLWISTFHGFCLRVLREERDTFGRFGVMGEAEQRRVMARAVRDDPEGNDRSYYLGESGAVRLIEDALTLSSRAKDEGISLADFATYADQRGVERLRELANAYVAYDELCRRLGKLDFGDLSFLLTERLRTDAVLRNRWRHRFQHIMVDEFQDINEVQWQLLTLLAPPPDGNLTVVGDRCQAIYAFRGASSTFFHRFQDEYSGAKNVVLTTNYRSRQHILTVAHALIGHNPADDGRLLRCETGEVGEPVRIAGFVDEDAEADYIARSILQLTVREGFAPQDCAILCRSVRQSAHPIVRSLAAYGIPFQLRGHDPAVGEALDDLSAVLRCIAGSAIWADAARVLVRRQVAMRDAGFDAPIDGLAQRCAERLGPNREILRDVPALDSMTYAFVTDWLDGTDSWQRIGDVRADLAEFVGAVPVGAVPGTPQGLRPSAAAARPVTVGARDGSGDEASADEAGGHSGPHPTGDLGSHLARAREALERLEVACAWLRTEPLELQVYASLALVGRLDPGSAQATSARAGVSACRLALRLAHGIARQSLGIPELLRELEQTLLEEESGLGERQSAPAVSILTLHAAKGLEWPIVFIAGCAAGTLPAPLRLDRAFDLDDLAEYVRRGRTRSVREVAGRYRGESERVRSGRFLQEERRLAYVGCTRAEERLILTYARSYDHRATEPSPFLAEMQKADRASWIIDTESDAGVMLPLDVARATRQQALAALGVSGQPVLSTAGGDTMVGTVLAAQYAAGRVPGGVPLRFRSVPAPYGNDSSLTVSFSGLSSYRTCPRQYFYGRVLHVEAPVRGPSVTMGNKHHDALACLNLLWLQQGAPPADDVVYETWRAVWPVDQQTIDAAMANPEVRVPWEPGFVFARQVAQSWQRGLKQLRRYYLWERTRWESGLRHAPIALEQSFTLRHGAHQIEGRIDCIMRTPGGDLIVDYKSGKKSAELKAQNSLQLAIYERAWAAGAGADRLGGLGVAYYFLTVDGDRGDRVQPEWQTDDQVSSAHYTDEARAGLWGTIDDTLARITVNDFAALPVGGKATCGLCSYSGWCEESLA